ncbi:ribose-phosphate diphosphokinase [Flexilinea flocculi]|uniref:ribose-phosphate diphosphokinase n=1 Tax=Flexilinea flocculi TaxID=1678840 RepID=A0A0S7BUT1_9CHLR|nr:ribose-phosphate diphosphokinase [Flexilinea flocculi]GAP40296.1 ribose-phosphate pyrophosphokinase [Flexilinea flocculi]
MLSHRHDLMYGDIKLFTGTSCIPLAKKIAEYLKVPLCDRDIIEFPNENLFVQLKSSVRGQDCYVIQTTSRPVHRNLMELLILIQTLRLDSAARITAVIPYLCYARSDKKDQPRVPITARLIADIVEVAGADRYMMVDVHAGQIQGFFSIPGDALTAYHKLLEYLKKLKPGLTSPVVVSTDLGFAKKARNIAEVLDLPLAFVEKRRTGNDAKAEALTVIGDVQNRDVILVDDEIDTGGSMDNAIRILTKMGAKDVYVTFVHAVFSGNAAERLSASPAKRFITTDTIPIPEASKLLFGDRLVILSVADLLGEVIARANRGISVGAMFNE